MVNRVTLAVSRSLPVFPYDQISAASAKPGSPPTRQRQWLLRMRVPVDPLTRCWAPPMRLALLREKNSGN
jgi:hypothetical protein